MILRLLQLPRMELFIQAVPELVEPFMPSMRRMEELLWTMDVENGDHSSPAVTQGKVFVSYACPQSYAFNAVNGQQLWHYSSCCEGGGGKTPVVHAGQVYVREDFCDPTNGLVLDANTGSVIGGFNSDRPPAFFGNLAVYLQGGTLRGVDIPTGQVLWSFAGDGGLSSAPVIVNQTIYIGSSSGTLFGLNASGQQIWSTQVGAPIPAPDEQNALLTTGLGVGRRPLDYTDCQRSRRLRRGWTVANSDPHAYWNTNSYGNGNCDSPRNR